MIGGPLLILFGGFVLVFFQPQKLLIDDRVDEAPPVGTDAAIGTDPVAAPDPGGAPSPPAPPALPVQLAQGSFRSLEHPTTGRAVVTELPDGSRVLRFEDFETSNGPDLRVYLAAGSNDANFGAEYGQDFVELGRLKGNIGSQNYEIPAGTDLSRYRNAVVWCKRFSVGFGVATLA